MSTPKSKLILYLESKIKTIPHTDVGITIVDGMFWFHLQDNVPATFGLLAAYILKKLHYIDGEEIHFVTDQYNFPSIKHCEDVSQ